MNLSVAWERLSARLLRRDLHHTIGRFNTVRRTYSLLQKSRQALNSSHYKQRLNLQENTLFPEILSADCTRDLRRDGVSLGLQLPSSLVKQVYEYACQTPLHEPGFDDVFWADDIYKGCLPTTGRPVMRGLVKEPENCSVVESVACDPNLLKIARNYLGYWPNQVTRHLTWTFVSELPLEQQKNLFLPLSYHYDVAGYNFMSAYFYITDMNVNTGAHVMIKQSHHEKPLHTLFAPWSGRMPDRVIWDYYGKENEIVIEGKAGFGFVQDPSCFHKLLPPVVRKRLLLQIRYA